ncbi:MAG: thioredoxin family protein [bacterium]|nr:thioredoxin family protein [bacterium]
MNIKILGAGCSKCAKLESNAKEAVKNLNIGDAIIEKVEDLEEIMNYNVMLTPALVVNNEVISSGKLLKAREIESILSKIIK